MTDIEQLNNILREQYGVFDSEGAVAVSPSRLAVSAYVVIDPNDVSPSLVRCAAILQLGQLSRAICRGRSEEDEGEAPAAPAATQEDLFDFRLQRRYPARRDDEDVYVLRECLTVEERYRNIQRLERESSAKQLHADKLRAETEDLIRRGILQRAAGVAA